MNPQSRVGALLGSKWRLDKLLGAGGSGAVYEATNVVTETRVALKMLDLSHVFRNKIKDDGRRSIREEYKKRFRREGYLANRVQHPGIVQVFDLGETEDGDTYLLMELLSGKDLEDTWEENGRALPLSRVLEIMRDILEILAAVHAQGIVHRDVKPSNIFLTSDGKVRLLDFGIALQEPLTRLTAPGHPIGTYQFMAPEQAKAGDMTQLVDIYSAGATLFYLLSGQYVHNDTGGFSLWAKTTTEQARSLGVAAPALQQTVIGMVDKALQFRPEDRWQTAQQMREAVQGCLQDARTQPTPPEAIVEMLYEQKIAERLKQIEESITERMSRHATETTSALRAELDDTKGALDKLMTCKQEIADNLTQIERRITEEMSRHVDAVTKTTSALRTDLIDTKGALGKLNEIERAVHDIRRMPPSGISGSAASPSSSFQRLLQAATIIVLIFGISCSVFLVRELEKVGFPAYSAPPPSAPPPSAPPPSVPPPETSVNASAASALPAPCPEGMIKVDQGSFIPRWWERSGSKEMGDFCIHRMPVTVEQYSECTSCTASKTLTEPNNLQRLPPCTVDDGDKLLPINCVNWKQARAFCEFKGWKLPSLFEWDYALQRNALSVPMKVGWALWEWTRDHPDEDDGGEGRAYVMQKTKTKKNSNRVYQVDFGSDILIFRCVSELKR